MNLCSIPNWGRKSVFIDKILLPSNTKYSNVITNLLSNRITALRTKNNYIWEFAIIHVYTVWYFKYFSNEYI